MLKSAMHIFVKISLSIFFLMLCACSREERIQGYVEGEFLYIASPFGGQLSKLFVKRGDQVKQRAPLFSLDDTPEQAQRDEAEQRLAQAKSTLDDISVGKRPSEIESLTATLQQAEARLEFSDRNYERLYKMFQANAISNQTLDEARARRKEDKQRVLQLQADLKTAKQGARDAQILAAQQEVRAREAELRQAQWQLDQKELTAPSDGLVFDTLFNEGEWVPGGKAVVSFLPPGKIKIKTFAPQELLSKLRIDQQAKIFRDGENEPIDARIRYISQQAEYTPPLMYSREARSKLVFLVELAVASENSKDLHPGEPVEVQFSRDL